MRGDYSSANLIATFLLEARIEAPVLDRLGDVLGGDGAFLGEIGDRASHAQYAVVGARGQQQPRERVTQKLVAFSVGGAVAVDLARAEQRVGLALPRQLKQPRPLHAATDRIGGLPRDRRDQFRFARRRHFELDVDAVGERTRDAAAVARDALGRAAAARAAVAAMAARAGIHRSDELETRRKLRLARGTRDR